MNKGVKIFMNLGNPDTIEKHTDLPFDGIGLMRIEFIIASSIRDHPMTLINRGAASSYVNELVKGIEKVVKAIHPKPIIVRFSDLKTNEYRKLTGGDAYEPFERNPMIGFRGASRYISDQFEQVFRLECKAILKLREKWENIWVMIPFIRTVWEAERCLNIIKEEGIERDKNLNIWLMAEVPAIAFAIDYFNMLEFDGYSIGSNDLTQLVLGVDRDNALLNKFGYFDERDPAVLEAMELIVTGAKRGGKSCSICGESVSDYPEITRRLVEIGIDSVSVNPDAVIETRKLIMKMS